jgi:S1-C subfamily serine protease
VTTASLKNKLGADFKPLPPEVARKRNLRMKGGVVVVRLEPDGPLARSGFENGDAILQVNGRPIKGLEGFVDLIGSHNSGDRVVLLALDSRTGQTGYVQVVLR